jgi:cytochrome P450
MTASAVTANTRLLPLPPKFWQPSTRAYFDPKRRSWQVFSLDDVLRVLTGTDVFSQQYGDPRDPAGHLNQAAMWAADDPRHADLKGAVAEPFKPRALTGLTPVIQSIADQLIDAIVGAGTGRFEVMTALAAPLPARVICHILGVDMAHDGKFLGWLAEFASAAAVTSPPAQPQMVDYFTSLLKAHEAHPGDGLVDQLLAAQRAEYPVAGEPLTDRDILGSLWSLLAAGIDTTATAIGNALLFLTAYDGRTGCLAALYEDRSLVPLAAEEVLRWYPPFPAHTVIAKTGLTLGEQRIQAGDLITGWITAANRHPGRFPQPGMFDIRRDPNPHLSFAWGPHFCLGAPLARLELCTVLGAVLARLPRLRWDQATPLRRTLGIVHRVEEAHMTFG